MKSKYGNISSEKNKILLLLIIMSMSIWLPISVQADCPDGKHRCGTTNEEITFGNCFGWKLCTPCREHDWDKECKQFERTTWMKDIGVINHRLRDIALPGAHDAGMGTISSCTDYGWNDITQTQTKSIIELLMSGIRVFDIRPTVDKKGNMRTAHISWIGKNIDLKIKTLTLRNEGCYGYSMEQILADVAHFRRQFPSELIILELSHFQNFKKHDVKGSHFDPEDFDRMKRMIEDNLGRFLIKDIPDPLNSKVKDLTDNGGVLVLMEDGPTEPEKGYYSYKDLRVSGTYANTPDVNSMIQDQLEKLKNRPDDNLFFTSWTLTQNEDIVTECAKNHFSGGIIGQCDSIISMASRALANLDVLEDWVNKHDKRPSVVYTDASNYRVTDYVIQMNR
ncbi:MAG: hypothetical protein D3915_15460 [Candidatus Electrothrix sp. AU1_5]|nr:hypothetical protein [Candidatus Electrothrix gigas]